ncbi:MAG: biotin transporter BioY [Acetivibrio sp.]
MIKSNTKHITTVSMTYIALFSVLIAVCSWISIPFTVPFTLQTFAVFCTLGLLGGKYGSLSILVYILLGAVGVPVFSGFSGGLGYLLGSTGGYILGFIFSALIYWLITSLLGNKSWVMILSMIVGLIICYGVGTLWFMFVYAKQNGAISILTALGWCVFPFIIPDLVKIALAFLMTKRLKSHIKLH